jgi:hypothetical protein
MLAEKVDLLVRQFPESLTGEIALNVGCHR